MISPLPTYSYMVTSQLRKQKFKKKKNKIKKKDKKNKTKKRKKRIITKKKKEEYAKNLLFGVDAGIIDIAEAHARGFAPL